MANNGHEAANGGQLRSHELPRCERARWARLKSVAAQIAIAIFALFCIGCSGPYSALDPAGPSARYAAGLWWAMAGFATVVFVVVVVLWLYALRRPEQKFSEEKEWRLQRFWLVGGGVALPTISIVVLLIFGIPLGHRMLPLPPDDGEAFVVHVTAHQWWWQVRYPHTDIELRDEVYIPAGVPIDVHLSTEDVIHSFWVPRLGGKLDTIPGRITVLRLQADEPGEYRGQCAEFCGVGHAHMQFVVNALSEEDFAAWLEEVQTDE